MFWQEINDTLQILIGSFLNSPPQCGHWQYPTQYNMKNRFPLLSEWLLLILISQLYILTCALTKCSLRLRKQVYASMKMFIFYVWMCFAVFSQWILLPSRQKDTSWLSSEHILCHTPLLLYRHVDKAFSLTPHITFHCLAVLSAQRSVLSPLPMLDNRHHRTQTPSDWS